MGILEIHFHDSDFSWTVNPRGSDEKTLSLDSGESSSQSSGGSTTETGDSHGAEKLWMIAALAAFVGLGVGVNKLRSRRASETGKSDQQSSGRRLSLSRSK